MSTPFRERWLPAAPALLLVVVACVQIVLSQTTHLNPWKGGGFGMFATVDHGSARRVRAFAEADAGAVRVPVPSDLEALSLATRQHPSRANTLQLAREVRRLRLADGEGEEPVRVEILRVHTDLDTRSRTERVLAVGRAP